MYFVSEATPAGGSGIFTGAGSLMGRLFNTTHQHFSSKLHLAPKTFVSYFSSSLTCHHHAIMHGMDFKHTHISIFINKQGPYFLKSGVAGVETQPICWCF